MKRDAMPYFAAAILILFLPLKWLAALVFAAFIHEMGHVLAVYAMGGRILELKIGTFGACLEVDSLQGWKEIICILAGPAASFSVLAAARYLPRTTVCAFIHGVYNLLPIMPLDGGRAVRCILGLLTGEKKAAGIAYRIDCFVTVILGIASIVAAAFLRIGLFPLILYLFAFRKRIIEKFLANKRIWGYNENTMCKEVRL